MSVRDINVDRKRAIKKEKERARQTERNGVRKRVIKKEKEAARESERVRERERERERERVSGEREKCIIKGETMFSNLMNVGLKPILKSSSISYRL